MFSFARPRPKWIFKRDAARVEAFVGSLASFFFPGGPAVNELRCELCDFVLLLLLFSLSVSSTAAA